MLRSAKRVLGLGNVFLMFIAIAYAAGGDVKHFSCYQSSVTQSSVDSWWFGGSLMELEGELRRR